MPGQAGQRAGVAAARQRSAEEASSNSKLLPPTKRATAPLDTALRLQGLTLVPSSYSHSRIVTAWPTSAPLGASTLNSVVPLILKRVPLKELRGGLEGEGEAGSSGPLPAGHGTSAAAAGAQQGSPPPAGVVVDAALLQRSRQRRLPVGLDLRGETRAAHEGEQA